MRIVLRVGLILLAVIFTAVAGVLIALATSAGLRLATRFVPGLSRSDIRGSLYSHIEADDVHFELPILTLDVRSLRLDWRIWSLVSKRTLEVSRLAVTGVDVTVRLPPATEEEEAPSSGPFASPLPIVAHDVTLAQARISVENDGETLILASDAQLIASGALEGSTISVLVEQLSAHAAGFAREARLDATAEAAIALAPGLSVAGDVNATLSRQAGVPIHLTAALRPPAEMPDISARIEAGGTIAVDGAFSLYDFASPAGAAKVTLHAFDPSVLDPVIPSLPINGEVRAALRGPLLSPDGYASAVVDLDAVPVPQIGAANVHVDATLVGTQVELTALEAKARDIDVEASGKAELALPNPLPKSADIKLAVHSAGNVDLPIPDHKARLRGDVRVDATWEDAWIKFAKVDVRLPAVSFDELAFETVTVRASSNGKTANVLASAKPTCGKRIDIAANVALHRTQGLDRKVAPRIYVHTEKFPLRYAKRFLPATLTLPEASIDLDANARADSVEVALGMHVKERPRLTFKARAQAPLLAAIEKPFTTPLELDLVVPREHLSVLLGEWGLAPPALEAQVSAYIKVIGTVYEPSVHVDVGARAQDHNANVVLDLAAGDETKLAGEIEVDETRMISIDANVGSNMKAILAGNLPTGRPLDLQLRIEPTELTRLGSFDARFASITGIVKGLVTAQGTVDKPVLDAKVRLEALAYKGTTLGGLELTGKTTGAEKDPWSSVAVALAAPSFAGGKIDAGGSLALTGERAIKANARIEKIDLCPLGGLVPRVRSMAGRLSASTSITGTIGAPKITGGVALENGAVDAWRLPPLKDIALVADLTKEGLRVKKMTAKTLDGGSLDVNAMLALDGFTPGKLTAHAEARKVPLLIRGLDDLRMSGDVDVKLDRLVEGEVRLSNGRLDVPTLEVPKTLKSSGPLEDVVFTHVPVTETEEAVATDMPLDLRVFVDSTIVRGKDIDVTISSKLSVENEDDAVALGGAVTADSGRVNVMNRAWEIRRVALQFNGTSDVNPGLDIALVRTFPEATVTLKLQGTLRAPELVLQSTPLLDRAQIVSLIVSGTTGGSAQGTGQAIAAAAISGLLGGITSTLASKVGIDVVRVDMERNKTKLELGKYIGEKFYVGYRRLLGVSTAGDTSNANELRVEYRLTPRLILESAFGDAGTGGLDLMWTYRY